MKDFLQGLKTLFFLILLGGIYGGAIGAGLALLTGNNAGAWAGAGAGILAGAWAGVLGVILAGVLAWAGGLAWALAGAGVLAWALAGVRVEAWAWFGAGAGVLAGAGAWNLLLQYLAKRNKTTPEALIETHIAWIFSFPIAIFRLLSGSQSSVKSNQKSKTKQRAWDVSLIITFTQELAEVLPEEWDEWQHWISDMMEDRTRMQAKGMSHRLVSLITFYRLTRFVWHIGIDKVFILATRRATR